MSGHDSGGISMKAKKEEHVICHAGGQAMFIKKCYGMAECLDAAYGSIDLSGCDIGHNILGGGEWVYKLTGTQDAYKNEIVRRDRRV